MQNVGLTGATETAGIVELPLVRATSDTLSGYGRLVDDPAGGDIEIVPWPATGRRPVDPGTGNQGGLAEGIFEFWWTGEVLYGRNRAVDDQYLRGGFYNLSLRSGSSC